MTVTEAATETTTATDTENHDADHAFAQACARGDAAALVAFETRFVPSLVRYVRSLGVAFDDDIAQRLRTHFLIGDAQKPARIATYAGRSALWPWLKVSALHLFVNHRREERRRRQREERSVTLDEMLAASSVEVQYAKLACRDDVQACLHTALAALSDDDRLGLQLFFLDGQSLDVVAAHWRLHRVSASRRLSRIRDGLQQQVRESLRARLGLDDAALQSVVRLVLSQLQLTPSS